MIDSSTSASCSQLATKLEGPILVIGASGFIGANLLRHILAERSDTVGTFFSSDPWRLRGLPASSISFCNLQDSASVKKILHQVSPKTIFDCSSFGAYSFENDYERIHQTNYNCLIRLLETLCHANLTAYIHAGSSSEYGINAAGPAEDALCLPNSHYAVSKIAANAAINYYGKIRGLPAINLRLYSVYGPYEDSSRLIPTLCRLSEEKRLPLFASPKTSRDFVHIDDVCRAFMLAALHMSQSLAGEAYNIGTGQGTTLAELAQISKDLFHIEEEPSFSQTEAHLWDVDDWHAAPGKAAEQLTWVPHVTLREGLSTTAQWWSGMLAETTSISFTKKDCACSGKNSVTAVIACYKDNLAIPIMHERLVKTFNKINIDYEIIFVNDCSPDDSAEVIRKISAADPHVIGITHSRNFGSQAAFKSGMELASMESVVLLDGDLQDPPELIESFVENWRSGFDVVYGRRIKREMPAYLEACYKAFYKLFSLLSEIPIPANAGDFSLMDRTVVHYLLQCKERDSFLRGLRAYVGFKQAGVDYIRPERMFGKSTNNWIRNIGWAKKAIFSFTRLPLHLLTLFGGLSLFGTALLAIWSVSARFFYQDTPRGITFISLLVMFFGSSTLLGLGLLGEYIGKIFEETKARPPFIRKNVIRRGEIVQAPETD